MYFSSKSARLSAFRILHFFNKGDKMKCCASLCFYVCQPVCVHPILILSSNSASPWLLPKYRLGRCKKKLTSIKPGKGNINQKWQRNYTFLQKCNAFVFGKCINLNHHVSIVVIWLSIVSCDTVFKACEKLSSLCTGSQNRHASTHSGKKNSVPAMIPHKSYNI